MFERYTQQARRAIFFARYEASELGGAFIETEHLLLGVMRAAPELLESYLGDERATGELRGELAAAAGQEAKIPTSANMPLSGRCKRALKHAAEESDRAASREITAGHLVLGLLRTEKGPAYEALARRGLSAEKCRQLMVQERSGAEGEGDDAVEAWLGDHSRVPASSSGARIAFAESDDDIRSCYPVMRQLRTGLGESEFLQHVREGAETQTYRLVFAEVAGRVAGVAGFRLGKSLAWGKFLYVDDLVVDAGLRSRGYGAELLSWLAAFAGERGCAQLHLDSGVQRTRAHSFCLEHSMTLSSHHFRLDL